MGRFSKWDGLAWFAAAGILAFLLFMKPILGVADNGDFLRIMGSAGLQYSNPAEPLEDKYFAFIHREFAYSSSGIVGYISTQMLVVLLASLIGKIFSPHAFDIRFLAFIYCAVLLIAFMLLLQLKLWTSRAAKLAFALLFLLIFLDVGYTAYFNSFYGEPMSFVFLLLTLAAALRLTEQERPQAAWFALFLIAGTMMTASKIQNAPTGIILTLLALRFLPLFQGTAWKKQGAAAASLILIVSAAIYVAAPEELRTINQYQSVFYGITKDSPTPEQDLRELGLDAKLSVIAGTNYFMKGTAIPQQSDELSQSFYPRINHSKIALFYLKHPERFWGKLKVTASNAMAIQPSYLGSYEKAAGHPPGTLSKTFALWSQFKLKVLPHSIWLLLGFFAVYYTVLLALYINEPSQSRRARLDVFIAVGLIAAIAFLVPLVGDGEADMEKHLFLFNVCFDVMFTSAIVWLVHQAAKILRTRAS